LSSEKGFEGFLKICEPPLARRAAGGVPGMGGAKEILSDFAKRDEIGVMIAADA
jgi:hypothetical protein